MHRHAMGRAGCRTLGKLATLAWMLCVPVWTTGAADASPYRRDSHDVVYDQEPRILWRRPRKVAAVDRHRWVRLAKDAVIAREVVAVPQARVANRVRIDLPERFGGAVPAASQFSRRLKDRREDACLMRSGRSAGEAWIQVCLADTDKDGLYDLALRGDDTMAIEPVRLVPAHVRRAATTRIDRRLAVERLGRGRAILTLYYVLRPGGNYCSTWIGEAPARPQRKPSLRLAPDASATVHGIRLRVRRRGRHWWVNARGAFPPWASLSVDGTIIAAGARTDCIR
jgi:hypothetical protein